MLKNSRHIVRFLANVAKATYMRKLAVDSQSVYYYFNYRMIIKTWSDFHIYYWTSTALLKMYVQNTSVLGSNLNK